MDDLTITVKLGSLCFTSVLSFGNVAVKKNMALLIMVDIVFMPIMIMIINIQD